MTDDIRSRLDRYDLDQLLALAKRERIIDGHEKSDGALNIHIDDMSASLDEDRACLYLRSLLRAWVLGGGPLAGEPPASD